MVQQVEKFTAQLQAEALIDPRGLVNAQVHVVSAWAIEVAAGLHVCRERTKVGNPGDRIKVTAVEAGAEIKVVVEVRRAGIRDCGTVSLVNRSLESAGASGERPGAIELREREARAHGDNRGDS